VKEVKTILANSRKQIILEKLHKEKRATVEELQDLTNSSLSTIRRDLNELEDQKLLRRVHGGAELPQDLLTELSTSEKSFRNVQEKRKIAQSAIQLITEGDTIYLDAGTTTGTMIPLLNQSKFPLTVVTNSVTHASKLIADHLTVHILGGLVKKTTDSVTGGNTLTQLSNYRFNIAFLGANAFDPSVGAMTPDSEEAAVKALAVQQ
jgi:DeoR family fructose operon transcriptional repressor